MYILTSSFKSMGGCSVIGYKVNDARIQLINMFNKLNQFAYDKIN